VRVCLRVYTHTHVHTHTHIQCIHPIPASVTSSQTSSQSSKIKFVGLISLESGKRALRALASNFRKENSFGKCHSRLNRLYMCACVYVCVGGGERENERERGREYLCEERVEPSITNNCFKGKLFSFAKFSIAVFSSPSCVRVCVCACVRMCV